MPLVWPADPNARLPSVLGTHARAPAIGIRSYGRSQIEWRCGMRGFIHEARSEAKPILFVLAVVAALGGFLFGCDTGVISGALLFIKPAFHASALQLQAITGSLLVGAVVGAAASGYLAEAMSRKWTKVLPGCIYVAAAPWSALASGATELIAARFPLGLAVGTASFVAPMYIAEVAPRRIRGGLVSFNQF